MSFTFRGRGKTAGFSYNGHMCRGLHKMLRRCFYPNFVYTHDSNAAAAATASASSSKVSKAKGRFRKGKGKDAVFRRGRQIDSDLTKWTRSSAIPKRAHPWSKMLIAAFQKWGWAPLEAQGIVGIPERRLATAFDLLMKNKKGEKVLVEVKSGFTGTFTESRDQKMEKPLEKVDSHSLNHALLQASVTAAYFASYREEEVKHVYVVRVNEEGCERFAPPPWIPSAMDAFKKFTDGSKTDEVGGEEEGEEEEEG